MQGSSVGETLLVPAWVGAGALHDLARRLQYSEVQRTGSPDLGKRLLLLYGEMLRAAAFVFQTPSLLLGLEM